MRKRFSTDPITLVPLAWNSDNSFNRNAFVDALDYLKEYNTFSLYFGCTASEGHVLSRETLFEITRIFVEQMKGYNHPFFVGLAGFPLAEIIERITLLKSLGVKTFLFALPSWGQLATPHEVDAFLNILMGTHKDCTFILYNNIRSAPRLYANDLLRVAKANPNFVAVKQGGMVMLM